MKKVVGCLLLIVMLAALITSSVATQTGTAQVLQEQINYRKDETVYASLNADGSISSVSIVNRIDTTSGGIYTDYGKYKDIKNLTYDVNPVIEDNKIIWQLPADQSGFYYEGMIENRELPILLSVGYTLDGKAIDAKDLAGKTGKVAISLKIDSNDQANAYFTDNYAAQLQIPLSLDKCSNIMAEGAQSVIVGSTDTLAFMIMPGSDKEFTITFDARSFEMDSITATLAPMDIQGLIGMDLGEVETGASDLSKGTGELVSGTEQLQEGLSELVDGLKDTAAGFASLQNGNAEFRNGLEAYTAGVSSVSGSASQMSQGLSQLEQNGAALSGGFTQLSQGTIQLLDGIIAGLPAEQQAIYSVQAQMLKQQMEGYGSNLDAYTQGVAQTSQGMTALKEGMSKLAQQGSSLVSGASKMNSGSAEFGKGLNSLYQGARTIPDEVKKLADGQKKLVEGIDEALELFDDFSLGKGSESEPVSFADNSRKVSSVQFVIRTSAIKVPALESTPLEAQKPQSFWEKLAALFK